MEARRPECPRSRSGMWTMSENTRLAVPLRFGANYNHFGPPKNTTFGLNSALVSSSRRRNFPHKKTTFFNPRRPTETTFFDPRRRPETTLFDPRRRPKTQLSDVPTLFSDAPTPFSDARTLFSSAQRSVGLRPTPKTHAKARAFVH